MTKTTQFAFSILIALCLLSAFTESSETENKTEEVSIAVYYESLCEDSIKFITTQLYPAYQNLSSYLKVELVPFGKATLQGMNFTCRHGEAECLLDKAQACVLNNKSINQNAVLSFVNCTMATFTKSSSLESTKECAIKAGIPYDSISSCAQNETIVIPYIKGFADKTEGLSPKLSYVPLVIFNGRQDDSKSAEGNFKKVACNYLSSLKLEYCKEDKSGAGTIAATFVLVFISAIIAKLA